MSEQEERQPELPCLSGKRIRRGIMWEHSVWRKQAQQMLKMKLLVHCFRRSLSFSYWFYCNGVSLPSRSSPGWVIRAQEDEGWGNESAYLFWLVTTHSPSDVTLGGDAGLSDIACLSQPRITSVENTCTNKNYLSSEGTLFALMVLNL